MKLTILMPTLNEEESIARTINRINQEALKAAGWETEILVVDGGSSDKTVSQAKKNKARVIISPRGYGRQYLLGFRKAQGEVIVTADSDCSYPMEEIPRLLDILQKENLDFISTNRFAFMEENSMNFLNKLGNKALTFLTNLIFRLQLKDSQSGMWIIKKDILEKMNLWGQGMSLSQEIKIEAYNKFRAKEVDSSYKKRVGKIKLRMFRDGWDNFLSLLKKKIWG
jgi:dolichol-phosphate hexosyltransferase